MRRLAVTLPLLVLVGCVDEGAVKLPPEDRLYYPTAIQHLDVAGTGGRLVIANSNFDGRYDFGSVVAVDVDALGLPAFPAPATLPDGGVAPAQLISSLGTNGADGTHVLIDSFAAGRFGTLALPGGGTRLFVPTRDERDRLEVVDVGLPSETDALRCLGEPSEPVAPDAPADCSAGSPSLTFNEQRDQGHPRAIEVANVAIDPVSGNAFVAHREPATDPLGSIIDPQSYLAEVNGLNPREDTIGFYPIGIEGSTAVAVGPRYAFLLGYPSNIKPKPSLLRMVDLQNKARVLTPPIEDNAQSLDGRDLALSSDGTQLYLLSRFPDALLVLSLDGASTDTPTVTGVRRFALPDDPNNILVLPRAGKGDVLVITCSQGDALVVYDADAKTPVAQLDDFGNQPYGMTADFQGAGVRIYVTNFSDGQLGVVDMPDLNVPGELRLIARVGEPQACLIERTGKGCE